jgi:phage repressor protein C with HTH and peptisase S24 domain
MDPGTRQYFETHLGRTVETASHWQEQDVTSILKLVILTDVPPVKRFRTHLPVHSLSAAAGGFSEFQEVRPLGWVPVSIGRSLNKDMFVAQVRGRSMEPTIHDGSYCVFQFERGGSRNGKVVLVRSSHIEDPENGGEYTVKRYFSEKEHSDDGTWRHKKVTLVPDNRDIKEITLTDVSPAKFTVIAEFISCLG